MVVRTLPASLRQLLTPTQQPYRQPTYVQQPFGQPPFGQPPNLQQQPSFNNSRGNYGGGHRGGNRAGYFGPPGGYAGGPRGGNLGGFAGPRGGFNGPQTGRRGAHAFNNHGQFHGRPQSGMRDTQPINNRGSFHQQTSGTPMSPHLQRMHSEVGLIDLQATPRNVQQARVMGNQHSQYAHPHALKTNHKAILKQAVPNANFVPQGLSDQSNDTTSFHASHQSGGCTSAGATCTTAGTSTPAVYSQAGGYHNTANPKQMANPVPPVEATPSHIPANRHADATPRGNTSLVVLDETKGYPTPTDGFGPMAIATQTPPKDDDAEMIMWLQLEAEKLAIDAELDEAKKVALHKKRLAIVKMQTRMETERRMRGGASFEEHDIMQMKEPDLPDWVSTSSKEKRDISPVRNSEGGVLDSASKAASPESKSRLADANRKLRWENYGAMIPPGGISRHRAESSQDARMRANVDNLVNSPESSMANGDGGVAL